MFGIELTDFVRFTMQLGAGVAGASALWGAIFMHKQGLARETTKKAWEELAQIAFRVHLAALFVFGISRIAVSMLFSNTLAHEGIVLPVAQTDFQRGLEVTQPAFMLLIAFGLLAVALTKNKSFFAKHAKLFFTAQLILVSFYLCLIVFTGNLSREQLFYSFHNWHSILTLGTVIVIDILYIATLKKDTLKRALFPFFPLMSTAIWIGLGLDFASVTLIFPEAIRVSQQFLFNQTVVAIIIINGALLSGKINDLLISLVKKDHVLPIPKNASLIFETSGSISIVSWLAITFLDFFELTLSYRQMFVGYITVIAMAFLTQRLTKNFILTKKLTLSERR